MLAAICSKISYSELGWASSSNQETIIQVYFHIALN